MEIVRILLLLFLSGNRPVPELAPHPLCLDSLGVNLEGQCEHHLLLPQGGSHCRQCSPSHHHERVPTYSTAATCFPPISGFLTSPLLPPPLSISFFSPSVEFCGYTVPHPTEDKIHFRIQTTGAFPNFLWNAIGFAHTFNPPRSVFVLFRRVRGRCAEPGIG